MAKHTYVFPRGLIMLLCFCGISAMSCLAPHSAAAQDATGAEKKDESGTHAPAKSEKSVAAGSHELPADGAGAHPNEHGGGHEAAHGKKNPYDPLEWKGELALWSFVTFVIFVLVLRMFAWGPLANALDTREAKIHANIAHAEECRIKAERMLGDYQAKLAAAQDEVIKTLAEARRDAEHTRQEILAQTEKDVATLKDRAVLEIQQTKDSALNELFSHMAGTVASAAEKVLGRALTDVDQDRLVNEALVEFSRQQAS